MLTTGETALLFSVTPDTVLKWVKSGKIRAQKTLGGHYRIHIDDIKSYDCKSHKFNEQLQNINNTTETVNMYCWQYFNMKENSEDKCHSCIIFKARVRNCYMLFNIPGKFKHLKIHCTASCHECSYYQEFHDTADVKMNLK